MMPYFLIRPRRSRQIHFVVVGGGAAIIKIELLHVVEVDVDGRLATGIVAGGGVVVEVVEELLLLLLTVIILGAMVDDLVGWKDSRVSFVSRRVECVNDLLLSVEEERLVGGRDVEVSHAAALLLLLRWHRGGRRGSLAAERQVVEHGGELGRLDLELALQAEDEAVAAADGVLRAHVGLVDERAHGVGAELRPELLERLEDVADPEETVRVEEAPLLVGGEVGRERAVRVALAPLVLARRARLVRAPATAAAAAACAAGGAAAARGAARRMRGGARVRVAEAVV